MASDRVWSLHIMELGKMLTIIRRLSKKHKDQPWGIDVHGEHYEVNYWPGDSKSGMFGGNSNWRGPICTAILSFLISPRLIRCLQGWQSTSY